MDMTEIEGELENKRRQLALRSDFNLGDVFRMFGGLDNKNKIGIDCDDLYYTITQILDVTITKDEVFIIFYKIDKNGNGIIDYNSFADCFTPRAYEYKILIESRGCFYGS
jgi:Ca2+-binding EF-hand superfamily protein